MDLIKKLVRRSIRGLGYDLRQRPPELIDFLRANAHAFEQNSAVNYVENIDVLRLDDICPLRPSDRAFLKIDTQGFEKEVLAGAPIALKSFLGILIEIPVVHMYENVWSFEEAVAFMKSVGFVPAQIRPVNFLWRQDPVCVSEFDCLFRRMNAELDLSAPERQ